MNYSATTVSQFLEHVKDVRELFRFPKEDPWGPWFRGQTEAQWDLRPRLYREYGGFGVVRKHCIEEAMREEFMVRAPALGVTTPDGDEKRAEWQWYFTMQHFGTPTRLLDWTDGALIALHFAVKDNRGLYDAAVWALDPYALNERVFSSRMMGKSMLVVPPSVIGLSKRLRRGVDRWLPSLEKGIGALPKKPIAILPTHTERRISTQRSCFTIHGADEHGLDVLWGKTSRYLAKIKIPASRVQAIRRELDGAGIDEATIYPDMTGLSRTISDRWKKDGHALPHQKVVGSPGTELEFAL